LDRFCIFLNSLLNTANMARHDPKVITNATPRNKANAWKLKGSASERSMDCWVGGPEGVGAVLVGADVVWMVSSIRSVDGKAVVGEPVVGPSVVGAVVVGLEVVGI